MNSMITWKRYSLPAITLLFGICLASDASGQIFGDRQVARPLAPRPRTAGGQEEAGPALESVGTIVDESARYLRGNRDVTDFVGADRSDVSRFVGMHQTGTGEMLQSAVDDALQVDTAALDVNSVVEPVIPPRLRLNAPRLELGFVARLQPSQHTQITAVRRLQSSLPTLDPDLFEVSVVDGVATLRGTVASERDRKMAELLLSFEPGIGQIQNDLTVATQNPTPTMESSR
jgi:hypothetical protein